MIAPRRRLAVSVMILLRRLADVSVGSVGSKLGYSTVVVRSEVGEKLVKNLEAAKDTVDKPEVAKLAKFKKARAEKSFASLNKS